MPAGCPLRWRNGPGREVRGAQASAEEPLACVRASRAKQTGAEAQLRMATGRVRIGWSLRAPKTETRN
jgi:hypothetical protein